MKKVFIDSNIIIYANDARDTGKQALAIERIAELMRNNTGVISTQVLQEYAVVAIGKLHQNSDVVQRQLLLLESFEIVRTTPALIRRAVELQHAYKINFWDAAILSTAEHARCSILLSEDLNPGQLYATVKVENPFC